MGHWCSICGGMKPNEAFSGRGHRDHICKQCQKMPKARRQEIRDRRFVGSVLEQRNISTGNRETLTRISTTYSGELGEQARVVLEVARVKPHRKRRVQWLRQHRRDLFDELVRLGFLWDVEELGAGDEAYVD